MGTAMAGRLLAAGFPLLVWNRTPQRAEPLLAAGARSAADLDEFFASCDVVILLLSDDAAVDAVTGRGTDRFAARVAGRIVVHMGTTEPEHSQGLETEVRAAGGRYVEAPVSGSRVPAEQGQLVALLAGRPDAVAAVAPLLAPLCREQVDCGPVPGGLLMKLAVNVFLIAQVTGLAESFAFARGRGLDLDRLAAVLGAGQMASPIMQLKTPKLIERDYAVQASISDVWKVTRLITSAARTAGLPAPLLDVCEALYAETASLGLGEADMAAVVEAIEKRRGGVAAG